MQTGDDVFRTLHRALRISETGDQRGHGLFATEPVAAGTLLWREEASPELRLRIRFSELDDLDPERRAMLLQYAWQVDENVLEGPAADGAPLRDASFVWNHSCDPTAWLVSDDEIVARRDIAAGEEVTCDYATWTTSPVILAAQIPGACLCGSGLCRGTISADDWRRPELQARYGDHFVSFILRRLAAERGVDDACSP